MNTSQALLLVEDSQNDQSRPLCVATGEKHAGPWDCFARRFSLVLGRETQENRLGIRICGNSSDSPRSNFEPPE
jgi:hypothetical protein